MLPPLYDLNAYKDDNGKLIKWAWPGGYPMYYVDKCGSTICPDCANREVDYSQEVVAGDTNWEDSNMYCDDCGLLIPSAYGDDTDEKGE